MKKLAVFLLTTCCLLTLTCSAKESKRPRYLEWNQGAPVEIQENQGNVQLNAGLARPFYGEHKGMFFIAGGANFDQDSKKTYYSEILACPVQNLAQKEAWKVVGQLPKALAEGGSISTSHGVVCVGGTSSEGDSSNVYLLSWGGKKTEAAEQGDNAQNVTTLNVQALPSLPVTVHMPAMAVWNNEVYVIAGRQDKSLSTQVWKFDLSHWLSWKNLTSQQSQNKQLGDLVLEKLYLKKPVVIGEEPTWERLPDLPGSGRTQAVAAIQNTDQKKVFLYVFGGCVNNEKGISVASSDAYGLDIEQAKENQKWIPMTSLEGFSTIGASAVASGNQHILVVGGFEPTLWNEANEKLSTLKGDELTAYSNSYFAKTPEEFNWNKKVMAYHTVTNKWFCYNELPFLPRCGAAVQLLSDGRLVVAGGEIKPKVRTSDCQLGTFKLTKTFSWINWAVIGAYFGGMTLMGIYFMRRNKNAEDYFKGGGKIPWWAVGMSIFATMLSSITFLSIPTMTYISDWRYFPMVLCIFLMAPVVIYFYLPFFRGLNITSAYEYLEKRFNLASRLFASLAFNVFMVCRVAVVTLLPSLAMSAVTGIDVQLCIVILGIITILYCAIGGIEAVIWSDFVQGIILVGGAFFVLILLIAGTDGGVGGFMDKAISADKFKMWDFRFLFSEPVFWVVMIQGVVGNLASYTSDQCVVQRYITTKDEKGAANSIWFNGIMSVFASILFYLLGTALYTHYFSNPVLMDVTMPKADSIFPIYMVSELPVGICGILIAAIFAATMSTLSSNLNSSATSITCDFVIRFRPKTTDKQQMLYGQIFTIIIGLLGIWAALVLSNMENRSLFDQFQKFIAMLTGGLACLFFMGIFTTRISGAGALIGLIVNYIVCYWLDFAVIPNKPNAFVYGGIGMVVCFVVAYVFSFIFPDKNKDLTSLTIYTAKKDK